MKLINKLNGGTIESRFETRFDNIVTTGTDYCRIIKFKGLGFHD